MLKLKGVTLAALGTALVVAACAAPTDPDSTAADSTAADSDAAATGEAATADPGAADAAIAADGGEEVGSDDAELRRSDPFGRRSRGHGHRQFCDRENEWHCRRGDRGWQWVGVRDQRHGDGFDRDHRRGIGGDDRAYDRAGQGGYSGGYGGVRDHRRVDIDHGRYGDREDRCCVRTEGRPHHPHW